MYNLWRNLFGQFRSLLLVKARDGTESAYPVREKVVALEKPWQASLCGLQTLTTWPSVEVCYMQSEILFDKRMRLRYSIRMKKSRAGRPYHHD
jgi:hypothetical protein